MKSITELEELKTIELNIMKIVHEFCEARAIKYFLTYGTLLGAIRHDGFIPWDDDIDIHMTREDYDRFRREFPEWGKERGIVIIDNHTYGNKFPRDIIKVCDDRTLLVENGYKNKCQLGVFVDIWPIDKVPETLSLKDKIAMLRIDVIKRMAQASDLKKSSIQYYRMNWKRKLFVLLFGHGNPSRLVDKQEQLSRKWNSIEKAQYTSFQANKRYYLESELFPPQFHKFEDAQFYIPNNYDSILKKTYGDYMKLPPINEQVPHHIQDVFWK